MLVTLLILAGIAIVIAVWLIGMYNGLVRLRNAVKNAWAQIDVQLKRRHDLIPNLMETVKGYMTHERTTLENVTNARNMAAQASGVGPQGQAEANLNRAMSQFYVVVENYPDLKASQNFLALQEELASTENKISFARQFYNDQVMQFNNSIQMFPSNVIAGMFNFKEAESFEVEDAAEREAPKVNFT